jgi:hypothetical protein
MFTEGLHCRSTARKSDHRRGVPTRLILSSERLTDKLFPQSYSPLDRAFSPRQDAGQSPRQWHTTQHAKNQSPLSPQAASCKWLYRYCAGDRPRCLPKISVTGASPIQPKGLGLHVHYSPLRPRPPVSSQKQIGTLKDVTLTTGGMRIVQFGGRQFQLQARAG